MEEKVVHMVLKVDLQCHLCYKKVRKILCNIPQIRDQVYNEKQGTVLIKVVCCTPEKIMKKICCKGDKSIESIEIKEPEKKNEEKEVDKKKVKKKVRIVEPKKEDSKLKVVAHPDQEDPLPPPQSVSSSSMYEGRPSYQNQDYGISMAPPTYVRQVIYSSNDGGYSKWDNLWRHYVGESSDNYNQRN